MKILALDDSELALNMLTDSIMGASPTSAVYPFTKPSELLAFAERQLCDIAFLDIKMWGMDGLTVAKKLKDFNPKINIIFVTAYTQFASQVFDLYPSGYVLKPVTQEAVAREIENLRHPVSAPRKSRIFARTFGNFEMFVDGTPLKFRYSKTKEFLAYLVDRNGATVNTNEICAVLWEDKETTENVKAYLRKLVGDLTKTLEEAGADEILYKRRNCFAIVPEAFDCDSYGFMKYDPKYVNEYVGQYMAQYSWAETTAGTFSEMFLK